MRIAGFLLPLLQLTAPTDLEERTTTACFGEEADISVDHVVIAVGDFQSGVSEFVDLGFTIKPGRPHANGLVNGHLKFVDETALELMSLVGEAADPMSRDYEQLIDTGGGGAFLALGALQEQAVAAAVATGLDAQRLDASPFQYVSFLGRDMASIFVVEYERRAPEETRYLDHENGVVGIREVWVEAGEGLPQLLLQMGAESCGPARGPFDEIGAAFSVRGSRVVVVAPPVEGRPRVLGVRLDSDSPNLGLVRPEAANGFWINFDQPRR